MASEDIAERVKRQHIYTITKTFASRTSCGGLICAMYLSIYTTHAIGARKTRVCVMTEVSSIVTECGY